jgi:hypothetical protein
MNGYPKRKTHSRPCVGDNDIVTGDGTMSIHDATRQLVVEVDGVSTRQTDSPAVLGGSGSGEGHAAKVGERGEALCATATDESEVPNDPFSIDLAERIRLAGPGVGDAMAGRLVLDNGAAGGGAGDRDGDLNDISRAYREAAEVGRGGLEPFVPGDKADTGASDAEVNTGLGNGVAATVVAIIPTRALAQYWVPDCAPEGSFGVGTVKVPVTPV